MTNSSVPAICYKSEMFGKYLHYKRKKRTFHCGKIYRAVGGMKN
jgi:hypothetical protein